MKVFRPGFKPQYIDESEPVTPPAQSAAPLPTPEEAIALALARDAIAAHLGVPPQVPSPEAERMEAAVESGQVAAASSPSMPASQPDLIQNLNPSPTVVEHAVTPDPLTV